MKTTAAKKAAKKSKQSRASSMTGYKLGAEDTFTNLFGLGTTKPKAGVVVTTKNATEIAAVFCAVTMLTNSVGSMPIHIYRNIPDGGKQRVKDHPISKTFERKPNNFMTPIELKSLMMNHILMRGDFISHILPTNNGEIHIIPMNPDLTDIALDSNYNLLYVYRDPSGKPIPFDQSEIFHVKGQFSDGLRGMSVIRAAREGLSRAKAADEHASEFFGNNSIPAGVLEYPTVLKKDDVDRLRKAWEEQHQGTGNRHRVAVLEQGMKWTQLGISNADAQWIEGRQFEIEEISRWFNIPPHKLKHLLRATFSNIEHQGQEYYEDSVLPHTRRIQEAITAKFFSEGKNLDYFAEFLFDSLLITDTNTRYNAHNLAINGGWKTRNEVRSIENLNPLPGLDEPLEPLNMAPAGSQDTENDQKKGENPVKIPQKKAIREAFSRVFEDAFGKVRSRETKKWADAAKKGTTNDEVAEFYAKIEDFIPEALDAVAISWGELFEATPSDIRAHLREFSSTYCKLVREAMKGDGLPNVRMIITGVMDDIENLGKED